MRLPCLCLALMTTTAAAAPLTPAEIRAELVGAPLAWWEAQGWRHGHLYLAPDGAARIAVGPMDDTGRWWQAGDQLCTAWASLRDGASTCYGVERAPQGRFLTTGGAVFQVLAPGA